MPLFLRMCVVLLKFQVCWSVFSLPYHESELFYCITLIDIYTAHNLKQWPQLLSMKQLPFKLIDLPRSAGVTLHLRVRAGRISVIWISSKYEYVINVSISSDKCIYWHLRKWWRTWVCEWCGSVVPSRWWPPFLRIAEIAPRRTPFCWLIGRRKNRWMLCWWILSH